jgi:hypothetical protein
VPNTLEEEAPMTEEMLRDPGPQRIEPPAGGGRIATFISAAHMRRRNESSRGDPPSTGSGG